MPHPDLSPDRLSGDVAAMSWPHRVSGADRRFLSSPCHCLLRRIRLHPDSEGVRMPKSYGVVLLVALVMWALLGMAATEALGNHLI